MTIDGKFGERWVAGGNQLLITLAQPVQIERVFFSSDRLRALGENYPLTTFVGDYRIETSLDGRHWTEAANSYDRVPASPRCKAARLRKLVTTKDDETQLADFDKQLAQVDRELARIPPLPSWWIGTHQEVPGPFQVFIGGDPQKPGERVVAASMSTLGEVVPGYRLDEKGPKVRRRVASPIGWSRPPIRSPPASWRIECGTITLVVVWSIHPVTLVTWAADRVIPSCSIFSRSLCRLAVGNSSRCTG